MSWHLSSLILLNGHPESKGSAVSVFLVLTESKLKFDKKLCHSSEKQNSVDSHQILSCFGKAALHPCATSKTRKHMVFPVPPATLQEMLGFGSSRMHWLEMPQETEGELIPNPDTEGTFTWPEDCLHFPLLSLLEAVSTLS